MQCNDVILQPPTPPKYTSHVYATAIPCNNTLPLQVRKLLILQVCKKNGTHYYHNSSIVQGLHNVQNLLTVYTGALLNIVFTTIFIRYRHRNRFNNISAMPREESLQIFGSRLFGVNDRYAIGYMVTCQPQISSFLNCEHNCCWLHNNILCKNCKIIVDVEILMFNDLYMI